MQTNKYNPNINKDNIRWTRTHCGRMDHGGCSLQVGVHGNQIVGIKGDPAGYLNRGYVCKKGLVSPQRLDHPLRLRRPLKRTGKRGQAEFTPITWEEAFHIICDHLNRVRTTYGARSVAFCQGMPKGLEHFVLIRLANCFGSPNVVAVQDVCHAPRELAGRYTCGFYPVADFHHPTKLIVLWGSNITATNEEGHICRLALDQIRNSDTQLMVIDPRRTRLAATADHWLQIRPGTDGILAMGFLHVIITESLYDADFVGQWTHGFDALAAHVAAYPPETVARITQVPPETIRQAARCYAAMAPAVIQWGNPIEHTPAAFDTARALVCLMAICGNLDRQGGNIQPLDPPILPLGKFVRADLIPQKPKEMVHAHHGTLPGLMTVPPAFFKKAVLEQDPYPIKAAYIQCSNPLVTWAHSPSTYQTLKALDFLAVSDIFLTPTAAMADLVLPAATHFEFDDIGHYGLGHGYILARPKIVAPPPMCRSDMDILNELGKRLTSSELWYDNASGFLDALLKPAGMDYTEFVSRGILKGHDQFFKYRQSGFRTPTGKVELWSKKAESAGFSPLPSPGMPVDTPDYPLVLTSFKHPCYLHSSYRWIDSLNKIYPKPEIWIHPDTAKQYGIISDDPVTIETVHGKITQTARLDPGISKNSIVASYGWWANSESNDLDWQTANYNMITGPFPLGREFGTPALKGIACRIVESD